MRNASDIPIEQSIEKVEHHMLQVLLPAFKLEKLDNARGNSHVGVNLIAEFDDATRAMWLRQQRVHVKKSISGFKSRAARIDKALATFRNDPKATNFAFSQPPFVFRYGNGGTLPILCLRDKEYYCLPYRDIPPIGWNLANGGSDSRHELLNPLATIERELREEIIIVNETEGIRYTLQWEDEDAQDRPEFTLAREFWKAKRRVDIGAFEERQVPVTWIHGPDAITVRCPRQPWRSTEGIFLNISAADFGIEADRIARLHVDDGFTILDGETHGAKLVDRPMGLFEVDSFASAFSKGQRSFVPDILFVSGDRVEGKSEIISAIKAHCDADNRPLRSAQEDKAWASCANRFALCPVTRQLVERHLNLEEAVPKPSGSVEMKSANGRYKVFLSSTGHREDLDLARKIRHYLSDRGIGPVFFYKESYDALNSLSWLRKIEDALLSATDLIVVCTNASRVRELQFEWHPFFTWLRYGRKKRGRIVPVVDRVNPQDLPIPLCIMDAVPWPDRTEALLKILRTKPKRQTVTNRGSQRASPKRRRGAALRNS